ncbi:serine/threonine protein kinase [Kibdelosporangium banguiense]|uniref:non-specific serine/threonine protein kinase n=1 Tax=Kibdelosporangium banguiense TaxID=1365924 RepID=A0ABS4TZV7_9PSEU|nr:serine/threonine-protein kinase [Kibdelosporangium banguiense]MBP2329944.1 serine/threonine protein kinase [Kibdelosporangium banguiense]
MRQIGGGRYTLVRELGRGGMGVVWLADDTVLSRAVAVKELMVPDGIPVSERAVYQERVLREARIAGRLANPGVVTVYDLIKDEGDTYIVMEFVQAPTLTELVERDGPMPATQAARLAGQLLSALEAAHDAGIVHRDVKPGNVMVPARDSAKLTDFGIAQSFEDPRLTTTGTLIGSPAYMSPERLEGGEVSPAWDLWALGATLFFAVEGHSAYQRSTTSATLLAVMTERPAPRLCQGPLAELIMGLLEPDPESRLRVPAARRLIEQAMGHAPSPDLPTVLATPPRKKSRKPVYASLIAVLAVAVFATVVIYSVQNSQSSVASPTTTSSVPTTTTSVRTTSKAMQPVLTYGPGGDIADLSGPMFAGDCLTWVPVKGGPAPDMDSDVGCYGPHDTEVLEQSWADRDLEKDVPYPPFERLAAETGAFCTSIFLSATVIGADKEQTLKYWVVVPNAEAWKVKTTNGYRISNRLTYCFVGKADGSKLTEPVMTKG